MKTSKIFLVLILMFNFGFGQKSLNIQFKKIIIERGETQNPNDTYIKNHEIWAEYFKFFKKDEIITFYTTSNLPFCELTKITIINNSTLSIGKDKLCAEPPEISVFDKQYEYKVKNNLLKIYSQKKIYCILKITKIENYQQEKFGKDSYKLTFLVIQ